jgi:hypothetical protein
LLLTLALPAAAQDGPRVDIRLMVSHVTSEPGPIDPRGAKLHALLRKQVRYESLQVLKTRNLDLGLQEIGSMKLPNGRMVRVRPLDVGKQGVLIAVDIEGSMQTDLRVPNRKVVVLGGQPYQGGRLVISLEPDY